MAELVSESITPHAGTSDAVRMAVGEPGLPKGFTWHGVSFEIVEQLAAWKESSREGSRAKGDLYLRRHYYRLQMSDESTWVV